MDGIEKKSWCRFAPTKVGWSEKEPQVCGKYRPTPPYLQHKERDPFRSLL